jgi:acylpyruvate hydrolase
VRLVTYRFDGSQRAGAVEGEWVVDLELAAGLPPDLRQALARGDLLERVRDAIRSLPSSPAEREAARDRGVLLALSEVALAPVIPDPDKIICLGRNYRAHIEEAGSTLPEVPELFAKYRNTLLGHDERIRIPRVTGQVDYEAELAVVIGRRGRYIKEEEAYEHVAGYTCFNDVSARDYQLRTSQWTAGKGFDGFGPLGPWLVTRDEIPDPHRLRICCRVGGEVLQDASTGDMVFKIPRLIAFISEVMTLEPGDVIATGTPAGVGFVRKPPRFLRPGDEVEVEIEGIGRLCNPVEAEA